MVGLYLAFMAVSLFLGLISGNDVTSVRYILGNLLAAILSWGFGMGFGKLILNILDGMEPKMSVFLSIWSRAWTYLKLEILILSVIVVLGLIAFIAADFAIKLRRQFQSSYLYSVILFWRVYLSCYVGYDSHLFCGDNYTRYGVRMQGGVKKELVHNKRL